MKFMKPKKPKRCRVCSSEFVQFNSLRGKVCSVECAIEFARQEAKKKADLVHKEKKKAYNENDTRWLEKRAIYYCNKYIRLRDAGQGCITCKTKNPNIVYAAGHYIPAGRCIPLRFNELNIHLQCNEYCNRRLSGNLTAYEAALRVKLGDDIVEWLKGPHEPVRYRAEDYRRVIAHYKAKIKELPGGK